MILTWDPDGEMARNHRLTGGGTLPRYQVTLDVCNSSFVPAEDWPRYRRELAEEWKLQFGDLSVAECERLVDGDVWIGLHPEHVRTAFGDSRIVKRRSRESLDGSLEVWRITVASISHLAEIAELIHGLEIVNFGQPSKSLQEHEADETRAATIMLLTFKDGRLADIERPKPDKESRTR